MHTTDDDVCENEEHKEEWEEQEGFLPEDENTEVNNAPEEKEQDTQGKKRISTEKHVQDPASKTVTEKGQTSTSFLSWIPLTYENLESHSVL